jgi:hypothetical protein
LNEDEIYSEPVTIDLPTLFKSIGTIGEIIELTLNVDLPLSELHRLNWMIKDQQSSHLDIFRKFNFIQIFYVSKLFLRTISIEFNNNHSQSNANSNISNYNHLNIITIKLFFISYDGFPISYNVTQTLKK